MLEGIKFKIQNLPKTPGVYLFYNSRKELIYVGKATSLRSRVRSYFAGQKSPRPIEEMIHEVVGIKWRVTDSVLEAIILEGEYIKKFQPKYNVKWRDDKSWNYLVITKDMYPRLLPMRAHELDKTDQREFKYIFGPYPGLNTKAALAILRRIFHWSNCETPHSSLSPPGQRPRAGSHKGRGSKIKFPLPRWERVRVRVKPCFYYHLGQCPGVCTGKISPKEYRAKVIQSMAMFLRGGKKRLIKKLEKAMTMASREENYEEAGRLRDQLRSLRHLHDIALLNESFVHDQIESKNKILRIEGYDISNLGAIGKVGSLVVFDEDGPRKSEYKRFSIRKVIGQSDVDCLAEVLERRLNHPEWPYPDLILIDGGKPQVNCALKVLRENKLNIPVVGLAKGPTRKKNEIVLGTKNPVWIDCIYKNLKLLIQVRDESHRFAIKYHRGLRGEGLTDFRHYVRVGARVGGWQV
jgi:excinuclease ABC subunit C